MKSPIYLDHAATSPTHPDVVNAMMPYFYEQFGNPSSIHQAGRKARKALDDARQQLAFLFGAYYDEVVFTSGGTEADNLAIFGSARQLQNKGNHVITAVTEHHAVLHAFEALETLGFNVTYLSVDDKGMIDIDELKRVIQNDTILVSIMFGNNETGTIQPIHEIGNYLQERGIRFHTDAVQAAGIYPIAFSEMPVDLMTITAHKMNGPKGIGALFVKKGIVLNAQMMGGEQEKKRRAGTENVPGAVGFAFAADQAVTTRAERCHTYDACRFAMLDVFYKQGLDIHVNSKAQETLPHILNVSFPGVNVETLLMNLDMEGVQVSSGSACTAGSVDPSHVLSAMFDDEMIANSAIRISFGSGNTKEEAVKAAERISQVVNRLKTIA